MCIANSSSTSIINRGLCEGFIDRSSVSKHSGGTIGHLAKNLKIQICFKPIFSDISHYTGDFGLWKIFLTSLELI